MSVQTSARGAAARLEPAPAPGGETTHATKDRLLDAAFRIFAEHGFEGTSIRAVTQAAGASVSAANYHFGSKHELLAAALRHRIEPVNQARLERLRGAEEAAGGRPGIEAIVDAYLGPLFEMRAEARAGLRTGTGLDDPMLFRGVAGRIFADPLVHPIRNEIFSELNDAFSEALSRALPDEPAERIAIFMHLMVSGMIGLVVHAPPDEDADPELARVTLTNWIVGGIRHAAGLAPEAGGLDR